MILNKPLADGRIARKQTAWNRYQFLNIVFTATADETGAQEVTLLISSKEDPPLSSHCSSETWPLWHFAHCAVILRTVITCLQPWPFLPRDSKLLKVQNHTAALSVRAQREVSYRQALTSCLMPQRVLLPHAKHENVTHAHLTYTRSRLSP